ncbi:MAG TPA: hypothetical protein VG323_04295 [Thermoanaerobaculia bacterium]|nr:hypothetical protein [Thermoanaerobaculia bacterium]
MLVRRLAVLVLFAAALPMRGAPWIGHGPVGYGVPALAGHGSDLYAGTSGHGFFRSGDGGRTWTEINDAATAHAFVYVAVADANGVVYAMTNIGLLATHDRGSSWMTISTLYTDIAGGLAIDGTTLYAYGRPMILARTADGGATWETIINGLNVDDDWVTGVAIHGNTLVAAETSGFYRSADHGKNWTRVSVLNGERAGVLADGTFLGGTNGFGVLRSTDDGRTWIDSNSGLSDSARVSPVLGIIPGAGATVYLRSNVGGAARSDDGGRTWTMINDGFVPSPPNIGAMTLLGTTLYAAAQPAVYRRDDAAHPWSVTAALPGSGSISAISANAAVTWAIDDLQVWRSVDGGSAWTFGNAGGVVIAADPADGAVAYSGTRPIGNPIFSRATISRTADGGASWTSLWSGAVGEAVQALAVDPRSRQSLYAGLNDGLLRSTDGGATWSTALSGESVVALAFDALTVYAATATGVFVSSDGGATWRRTLSGAAVAVATTTRFAFAATDAGLFSSLDHGANWTRVAGAPTGVTALASGVPDRLFVASAGDLFELRDGLSWIRWSDASAGSPITALSFGGQTVLAGTASRGVLSLSLPPRLRAMRPR